MTETLSFEDWMQLAAFAEKHPDHRFGQHWFDLLVEFRPDIAELVRGSRAVDPFYNDKNFNRFLNFVRDSW